MESGDLRRKLIDILWKLYNQTLPKELLGQPHALIAAWWVSWSVPIRMNRKTGMRIIDLDATLDHTDSFPEFYDLVGKCMECYKTASRLGTGEEEEEDTESKKRALIEEPEENSQTNPIKKRKYEVARSENARTNRENAQVTSLHSHFC